MPDNGSIGNNSSNSENNSAVTSAFSLVHSRYDCNLLEIQNANMIKKCD